MARIGHASAAAALRYQHVIEQQSGILCGMEDVEEAAWHSPILFVTGAPAAGKTTVVHQLAGTISGAVVFDTDLLSHPDWRSWATNWLRIAESVSDNGLVPVLCGYGLHRGAVGRLRSGKVLGPSRCLYLEVSEQTIRSRLSARGGFDEERIARKLQQAGELRADADLVLDINRLTPAEVAGRIREWVEEQIPRIRR